MNDAPLADVHSPVGRSDGIVPDVYAIWSSAVPVMTYPGANSTDSTALLDAPIAPTPRPNYLAQLDRLLSSNLTLFFAVLALNAATQSYSGFVHDARLYAVQVLNRIDPSLYAHDLYLRYGSQDKYSAFSLMAAPLVRSLGLSASFFLLYVVGNALFYLGLMRLVLALVPDRRTAVWSLLFVAVTAIPFGGVSAFHANETFLTPRVWASGLVLLGLEQMVRRHSVIALELIVGGLLMHPLMAFPGLLVFVGWHLAQRLTGRQLLAAGIVVILLGSIVLLVEPLGVRLFGRLDEPWKETIRYINACNFPLEWSSIEWLAILVALGITLASGAAQAFGPSTRRFAHVLVGVALVGLVGAFLAAWLPYALLLQGQPYRVLWLLQLLQVPLGFVLMKQSWERGDVLGRAGAVVLLTFFSVMSPDGSAVLPPLVLLAALAFCFSQAENRTVGFMLVGLLAIGLFAWAQLQIINGYWQEAQTMMTTLEYLRTLPSKLNPLSLLVLGAAVLLLAAHFVRRTWVVNAGLTLVALGLPLAYWGVPQVTTIGELPEDTKFVKKFLDKQFLIRQPVVYWPVGQVNVLWFDLGTSCYFERFQLAGNLFHRDTAMEGQRRALLVKPFEIDLVRRNPRFYSDSQLGGIKGLYQAELSEPEPTEADVLKLMLEDVDFLVLRQGFEGLYTATNGEWYIYNCVTRRSVMKGL